MKGVKKMSRLSEIFYCMYIGGNPDVEGLECVGRWDGNITLERMEDELHKLLAEDAYETVMDFASEIQEHFFRKGFEISLMLQREGRG